jgi:hypothetical protein
MPEGYPFIKDPFTIKLRKCRNNNESVAATRRYHTKWMHPSSAEQQFWFGELESDEVGPSKITPNPYREVKEEDVSKLLPRKDTYSQEMINTFMDAHNSDVQSVFNAHKEVNENFAWPFYVHTEKKWIESVGLEKEFWQAVEARPGKARHHNFHLAIFGRLPRTLGQDHGESDSSIASAPIHTQGVQGRHKKNTNPQEHTWRHKTADFIT